MKDIDGRDQKLEQYKGKVVLIVNVASRCGYTPQYEGLERLYQKKPRRGPGGPGLPRQQLQREQEPGTDAEIKEFCTSKYGVTFPMFSKISVTGQDQHPLYKKLASASPRRSAATPNGTSPSTWSTAMATWSARYSSNAKPDEPKDDPESKAMADKIDELLKAK
jgi:glutathione peroxidase